MIYFALMFLFNYWGDILIGLIVAALPVYVAMNPDLMKKMNLERN